MVRAACHCTTVRFELAAIPEWLLDCNCTICRRYGALWAYPEPSEVMFVSGAEDTDTYTWGDRMLALRGARGLPTATGSSPASAAASLASAA